MPDQRVALISGVTGQDGAYLAELLLSRGYVVHGIKRRSSSFNTDRVDHLYRDQHEEGVRFFLHYGDLTDSTSLIRIIHDVRPDEIYNLGAQSHVMVSFETPEYTANADGTGTLRLLDSIRILGLEKSVRFYQASTSELYGNAKAAPQDETTPFHPRSPYAVAKLYAHWITVNYRESYGMFASNGILFNHESPIRGETFVTRKITRAVARIALGLQGRLYLGNIDVKRDWGFAGDYVEAMWRILQHAEADDFVVATGEAHSVREFAEAAFAEIGVTLAWRGRGKEEQGLADSVVGPHARSISVGQTLVEIDPRYYRPAEVPMLLGNAAKARTILGWEPRVRFAGLVSMMVKADVRLQERELWLKRGGFDTRSHHE